MIAKTPRFPTAPGRSCDALVAGSAGGAPAAGVLNQRPRTMQSNAGEGAANTYGDEASPLRHARPHAIGRRRIENFAP